MKGVNQLASGPDADFHQVFGWIRDEVYIDIVSGFNARDLERMSSDGDLAIGDSTVETRTIPQTLQAIDILSESEDLLGMFCDCIVKNKSIGIYDGAY